jgi:hypothetical protein
VPTFEERGCHVVSVTDPYSSILGFLDRTDANYNNNNKISGGAVIIEE